MQHPIPLHIRTKIITIAAVLFAATIVSQAAWVESWDYFDGSTFLTSAVRDYLFLMLAITRFASVAAFIACGTLREAGMMIAVMLMYAFN